ncbi:hypothetical protein [uncultured Brevundimonas sp.]|uniref:hypothetical protein n=1 Tax=uncultured Brevundimonas sp. TaxID=213418 RepID=UPI0030EC29A4
MDIPLIVGSGVSGWETSLVCSRLNGRGGRAVEYVCYIELGNSTVPLMDIVEAGGIDAACEHARWMMGEHPSSTMATIYLGDAMVGSLRKDPTSSVIRRAGRGPNATLRPAAKIPHRR